MFCSFPNIFSQSYIVRLFRFAIALIHTAYNTNSLRLNLVRVKEILNLARKIYIASVFFVSMAFREVQI